MFDGLGVLLRDPSRFPWGSANVVPANRHKAMVYSEELLAYLLADVRGLDGWPSW